MNAGSSDNTVSLQCLANDAMLSSVTVLLSITSVDISSLSSAYFPDDIIFRLCLPHARENVDNIRIVVGVLDFVRSVLQDVLHELIIVLIILYIYTLCPKKRDTEFRQ